MNTQAIDLISNIAIIFAIILTISNRSKFKTFEVPVLLTLLLVMLSYIGMLMMYIDKFEDIAGALIPILFAFLFYSIIEKRNLLKIKEKEGRFKKLFEGSNDAILLLAQDKIFDCNQRTFEMFQCKRSHIIGKDPALLSPTHQPDGKVSFHKSIKIINEIIEGNIQVFDWQHIRPNGELFDVSVSLSVIAINHSKVTQAVLRDITEKKKIALELKEYQENLEIKVQKRTKELNLTIKELKDAQTQLVQSEKMASLGILTAGVAHEINNPLNYIHGGLLGIKDVIDKNNLNTGDTKLYLHSINEGLERATKIIKSLNQFSRTKDNFDEYCHVHNIIENCLLLSQNMMSQDIVVNKYLNSKIDEVKGNSGKLHQVFINLITNACQAMNKQGTLIILTNQTEKHLIVQVIDDGTGISPENLTKLTVPFFTTKEQGEGTGLGLSISWSIIQEHNGFMDFESTLDKGTTVTIKLPLSQN